MEIEGKKKLNLKSGLQRISRGKEKLSDSVESMERTLGFSLIESISAVVFIGVIVVVIAIIATASVPAISEVVNPKITIDDDELETNIQEHNFITGSVSVSKGQKIILRAKNGKKVDSCLMKDRGVRETFVLDIPKVEEGTTFFYVEQTDKEGEPLGGNVSVSVKCVLPKKEEPVDMSIGTNPQLNRIVSSLCWPMGTAKKTILYKSGAPKDTYVEAAKKYLGREVGEIRKGKKVAFTDCSYFVATVIRMTGVDPKFRALRFDYAKKHDDWEVISEGQKVNAKILVAGDVIQYRKKGGGNHVIIYLGNKYYAQASRNDQFPRIFMQRRPGHEMYNAAKVNIKSLQVIRNKKLAAGLN